MRNPKWQRDELILALDLYFRHNPSTIGKNHPEVEQLSNLLNQLPIHGTEVRAEQFRNSNGVYMKMCNFLRFDPEYSGVGLARGGRLEEEIWNEFSCDCSLLRRIAQGIINGLAEVTNVQTTTDEDETDFPEGKILYRVHRQRERNRGLVEKVKRAALHSKGTLECACCEFDFEKVYGSLGADYIECHHTIPVSEYTAGQRTRISDLVLVCANCHRMLHRRRPWLTIDQLKSLLIHKQFCNEVI